MLIGAGSGADAGSGSASATGTDATIGATAGVDRGTLRLMRSQISGSGSIGSTIR